MSVIGMPREKAFEMVEMVANKATFYDILFWGILKIKNFFESKTSLWPGKWSVGWSVIIF